MTLHPDPRTADSSRPARAPSTVVCAVIALIIAVPQVVGGAAMWIATANDPTDDPLVGLGYLFALFLGVPGVLGLLLAVPALVWGRRPAGLVLALLALVAVALPLIVVVVFLLPGPMM